MDNQRYTELMLDEKLRLTPEELAEGWHFCPDLDYLLCKVGEGRGVIKECTCDKGCLSIEW